MYNEYKINTEIPITIIVKAKSDRNAWNRLAKIMHDEHYMEITAGILCRKAHTNEFIPTNDLSTKFLQEYAQDYWFPVFVGKFDKDYDGKKWKVKKV